MSEGARDALRQRFLRQFPTIRPIQPQGQVVTTLERRPRVHSAERAIGYVERRDEPLPDPLPATLVAFYLPQFHTIPENDEWWGKGFTEWRNVTRALPQFEGHMQPRLPGDLGFYDLRNPQVMRDQAELAKAYGLSAFCFYFYWFGGKTLLEDPLKQWLADKSIDFQYCLCWANENWTRRWDGNDEEILIGQSHSPEDDLAFIEHIAPYLRDPRYLRVDGKPLLLLYRPGLLPDVRATAERWRTWCRENGIGELELAYVQSFERPDPADIGFDAAVEFPPNLASGDDVTPFQRLLNPNYSGQVLDWLTLPQAFLAKRPSYRCYPGINCGWDNESRRPGRGRTFIHASSRAYGDWLYRIIKAQQVATAATTPVFVNAWNEWAEGAVLEPDTQLGYAWLADTRRALKSAVNLREEPRDVCVVLHAWDLTVAAGILARLRPSLGMARLIITTGASQKPSLSALIDSLQLQAEIEVFENRGRDLLPFLHVAERLIDDGEELVLKLHTKRSTHRVDGDRWRTELIDSLAAPAAYDRIARNFQSDPSLGLVGPAGHIRRVSDFPGANDESLAYLARRSGVAIDKASSWFCAGSMFWIRLRALRPVLDMHLATSEFEIETGQIDGTLAHALERFIGAAVEGAGYTARDSQLNPVDPAHLPTDYRFATGRRR